MRDRHQHLGFGMNAYDRNQSKRFGDARTDDDGLWLWDEQAVNAILTGLRFLGRHVLERATAGGNALVYVWA